MPEKPGRLAGSMKWHVARYPQLPGKLIVLGSVLTKPDDPESSLTRTEGVVPIPEADLYDQSDAVKVSVRSLLSKGNSVTLKALPPVSPLFNAGLSVEGGTSRDIETTVDALNVRAKIFIPTAEYMASVLAKDAVVKYVRQGLFAKSLYMIVGVATANRVEVKESRSKGVNAGFSANVSVPLAAVEGELGFSHDRTRSTGAEFTIENDVDFAYRAKEFEYSKIRRKLGDGRDLTDGALMRYRMNDSDDSEGARHGDEDAVPQFEGFETEDAEEEETESVMLLVDS